MYGSVEEWLKANAVTSGIAGLPAKLTVFSNKLSALDALEGVQTQPTTGQTSSRDDVVEGLIATTLQIGGIVGAYASDQKLSELAALVDVQRGDFVAARLSQRPLLAQRVHDAAVGVVTPLANASVTTETLAAFQDQINDAKLKIRQPRMTIVAKRGATSVMVDAFRDLDTFLGEQIDRLVRPLEQTNPGAYAQYQAARTIINVPGSRSAPDPAPPAPNATTAPTAAASAANASPVAEQKAA